MAVYTCYDMVRDCAAGKREGWHHFVSRFLPAAAAMLDRYVPGCLPAGEARAPAQLVFLKELRDPANPFFTSLQPAQERVFLVSLRDELLRLYQTEKPDSASVLLDAIVEAWKDLTVVEKQFAWLESMGYPAAETAEMMFADAATVSRIREKASDLLRGQMDAWSAGIVARSGATLRHQVPERHTEECIDPRVYCDAIDGRLTWKQKTDMEYHLGQCWWCIDRFCRIRDADWTLSRTAKNPPSEEEVNGYLESLGYERPRKSFWKKVLGA